MWIPNKGGKFILVLPCLDCPHASSNHYLFVGTEILDRGTLGALIESQK